MPNGVNFLTNNRGYLLATLFRSNRERIFLSVPENLEQNFASKMNYFVHFFSISNMCSDEPVQCTVLCCLHLHAMWLLQCCKMKMKIILLIMVFVLFILIELRCAYLRCTWNGAFTVKWMIWYVRIAELCSAFYCVRKDSIMFWHLKRACE